MFIKKYIQVLDTQPPPDPPTIHGYCNNSGLIQQVTALQSERIPNPSQTIANNYDLSNKIYQMILRIPFPVKLHHVKGYQDTMTEIKDLPYEAQLNIVCDACTCDNLANLPPNIQPHMTLPSAYPHLSINNCIIVHQLSPYMREQALLPEYYGWFHPGCSFCTSV